MPLKLEIVTQERRVYSAEDVEMVIAPGSEGEMGILPRHAPLITSLNEGVMRVKRQGGVEELLAIHGGFMEVLPDRVTVLADVAERAEDIDVARAQEARQRAEALMQRARTGTGDYASAEASLRRSIIRLKIVEGRRRHATPIPRSKE